MNAISKSSLSPDRRRLVELMQRVNFGRIEGLIVRNGDPIFDDSSPPRLVIEVKFGGDNGPRPESGIADFSLKTQVVDLFAHFDRLQNGRIHALVVSRAQSESSRDIAAEGWVHEPRNAERKDACRRSFRLFCDSYFPQTFHLAWSPDHLKVIGKIETAVIDGGLFAMAMPRGSGKTTLCETACLWALLFGHREFVALNRDTFVDYGEHCLAPALRPDDVMVMDM